MFGWTININNNFFWQKKTLIYTHKIYVLISIKYKVDYQKIKLLALEIQNTRNASNTHSNTHFSTHSLWLVKIHMGSTKFMWDSYDLEGPM